MEFKFKWYSELWTLGVCIDYQQIQLSCFSSFLAVFTTRKLHKFLVFHNFFAHKVFSLFAQHTQCLTHKIFINTQKSSNNMKHRKNFMCHQSMGSIGGQALVVNDSWMILHVLMIWEFFFYRWQIGAGWFMHECQISGSLVIVKRSICSSNNSTIYMIALYRWYKTIKIIMKSDWTYPSN